MRPVGRKAPIAEPAKMANQREPTNVRQPALSGKAPWSVDEGLNRVPSAIGVRIAMFAQKRTCTAVMDQSAAWSASARRIASSSVGAVTVMWPILRPGAALPLS